MSKHNDEDLEDVVMYRRNSRSPYDIFQLRIARMVAQNRTAVWVWIGKSSQGPRGPRGWPSSDAKTEIVYDQVVVVFAVESVVEEIPTVFTRTHPRRQTLTPFPLRKIRSYALKKYQNEMRVIDPSSSWYSHYGDHSVANDNSMKFVLRHRKNGRKIWRRCKLLYFDKQLFCFIDYTGISL